jgi:cell division septation protein DedD
LAKAFRSVLRAALALGAAAGVTVAHTALADVKAGVDAWARGDFPRAVAEWKGPADAGDPDAQFNMAQAYKLGRGVPRDFTRAEALYAMAATKGHLQASDNYGLMLFQRGERAKAMPYIRTAAERGDARAQYYYGLTLFNGDGVEKDALRAYAYLSMAQQSGLPQATGALAQMDADIPMADRQKAVVLASKLAAEAEARRARQVAAMDLGGVPGGAAVSDGGAGPLPAPNHRASNRSPSEATVEKAASDAARAAARPAATPAKPAAAPAARRAASMPSRPASGPWRVQLGAFGVPGNADALWSRVKGRPELAGHGKVLVPAGKLTKLQAGGFASQAEASAACARLKSGGFACVPASS